MKIKVVREKIKRTYRKNDMTIIIKHKPEFENEATALVNALRTELVKETNGAEELQEEEI